MRRLFAGSLTLVLGTAIDATAQRAPQPPATSAADSARRLPRVVVTATRDSIAPLASPLPTAALDATALRREHGVSLAHTLDRLPGVRTLSTGEQVGKPVVRGLSGARVLVLDDGMRLEDYSWSDEDGPSIDARLADRVEVIRGPASVLYGSDALGGVVNAIPSPIPRANRGRLELYGASNNREAGAVLGLDGARGRLGGRFNFVFRRGQDVHTPAGPIRNTGFVAANGEAALGFRHASGAESALRLAHYGGEFKLLEIDAPPGGATEEEGPERITLDDRLQLAHRRRLGTFDLELRAQVQRHGLQEKSDLPNPTPGQPKEATVFDLLLTTATSDLLLHNSGGAWSGTLGVSGLVQRNDSRGIIPLVPDATIASAAAFAFERLTLGRLALLAGVRGDARTLSADADPRLALADQSRHYAVATGDLGAVYTLTPSLAASVNVGRAWRAPTLFELFANGPRLGEGRYEYGQPALDPERTLNVDASLRWDAPRVHAEASAFRTHVDDYIYIAPTGTAQNGLRVFRYDRADALLLGGETSASVDATNMLTLRGRLDAVRGTNTTADDPLPLMPPLREAVGAELHGHTRRFGDPYLSADVEHVARQTRLSRAERSATVLPGRFPLTTDAYTLLDLGAGVALPVAGHATHLDLHVRNATDRRYRDFLNRYKEFAYAPGANVTLRATTTF